MILRRFPTIPHDPKSKHSDSKGRLYIHHISDLDERYMPERAYTRVKTLARCGVRIIQKHFADPESLHIQMSDASGRVSYWGSGTTAIYVFIHGLKMTGIMWCKYAEAIMQNDPNAAIFMPTLADEHSSPRDLAQDILREIYELLRIVPHAPLCIVSYSNGVRIASELEYLLREEKKALLFVSIAGMFYGTRWVDIFNRTGWVLGKNNAIKGMGFGNAESRAMIDKMRNIEAGCPERSFAFFISLGDEKIFPPRGSAPCLGMGEEVYIAYDLLHYEVFEKCMGEVLRVCSNYVSPELLQDDIDLDEYELE